MKKIALLGDSIRLIGYGKHVPDMLGEEYEVYQPSDNCRFAKHTMRMIFDLKDKLEGSDVIHWNNGIWDTVDYFGDGPFSTLEDYVHTMVRIAKVLKGYSKKVIFATTTPGKGAGNAARNEHIVVYNRVIVKELESMGVLINDLYSTVKGHEDEYICKDNLHLSEEGEKVLAKQVCAHIIEACKGI